MTPLESAIHNVLSEALARIAQLTDLVRQHVRERDMDEDDLSKLVEAEQFVREEWARQLLSSASGVTPEPTTEETAQ
jgi:hypothetical protein